MCVKQRLTLAMVAMLFGVEIVSAYLDKGSPDKKAGYKTNHLSAKGIAMNVRWYKKYMAQLDVIDAKLRAVQSSIDSALSIAPNLPTYMTSLLTNVTAKLQTAQNLYNTLGLSPPGNSSLVAFFTGAATVTYNAASLNPILLPAPMVNTGHWGQTTGVFTAPVAGLYWFLIRTAQASSINIDLMRNGVESLTKLVNSNFYDVKMRTAIRFLNAGDIVALYSASGTGTRTLTDGLYFSGQLLNSNAKLMPSNM